MRRGKNPSLVERGRGPPRSGGRVRARERAKNLFPHSLNAAENVRIPEPHHPISLGAQKRVALPIGFTFAMLRTIRFDNQPALLAHKIHNERSNWLLPSELRAIKLSRAKDRPQFDLRIGHLAAQALGASQGLVAIFRLHALTLPSLGDGPLPLPQGERGWVPALAHAAWSLKPASPAGFRTVP